MVQFSRVFINCAGYVCFYTMYHDTKTRALGVYVAQHRTVNVCDNEESQNF